jgi:hypothetical protein
MNPAQRSALKRGGRYFGYQLVGVAVANAAALAGTVLVGFHAEPGLVTVGGWLAASVAAAAKRAYSFAETGTPPPEETLPTLQVPTGGTS